MTLLAVLLLVLQQQPLLQVTEAETTPLILAVKQ
jgi:hypothetical protein